MSIANQPPARPVSSFLARLARPGLLAAALSVAGAVALAAAGCDKNSGGGGGGNAAPAGGGATTSVAIVDLDRVARSAGWEGEIQKDLQTTQDTLKRQIEEYARNAVQPALEARRKAIAAAARLTPQQMDDFNKGNNLDKLPFTQAQKEDFARANYNAQAYVQKAQQDAGQIYQQRGQQLRNTYLDALRPVVRRVASAQGVAVVMTTGPQIFYNDAATDITDKTVDEVQKSNPPRTFPDPPRLTLLPPTDLASAPPPSTAPAETTTTRPAAK